MASARLNKNRSQIGVKMDNISYMGLSERDKNRTSMSVHSYNDEDPEVSMIKSILHRYKMANDEKSTIISTVRSLKDRLKEKVNLDQQNL